MRITFVGFNLWCGGAERAMSNMANYWAKKGWEITILTLIQNRQPLCYDLHPDIEYHDLGYFEYSGEPDAEISLSLAKETALAEPSDAERAVLEEELGRLAMLRRAIIKSRPQAVIAFQHSLNVRVLLATRGLNIPVIVSERSTPPHEIIKQTGWALLRLRLYPTATCLVTLTEEALSYFPEAVRGRGRVIPNLVLSPAAAGNGNEKRNGNGKVLMAMGRLAPVKGFDLLLRAFALVAREHPSWSLEIWGEGLMRTELGSLAAELGITERVRLPGFTKHPHATLRRADLFAMSSRYEGFPNALCEAMACGLAAVSFDCPGGPRNIIRDGVDGVLVEAGSVTAMAASLNRLMGDEAERNRLGVRAREVVKRFDAEKIMAMWERLILNES